MILDDGKVMGSIRREDSRYVDDYIDESDMQGPIGNHRSFAKKKQAAQGNRYGSHSRMTD